MSQFRMAPIGLAAPEARKFRRIVLKVGSSLLVDQAEGQVKRVWLEALADDLGALHGRGADVLVVSSGAIAPCRASPACRRALSSSKTARPPPPSARSRSPAPGPRSWPRGRSTPAAW